MFVTGAIENEYEWAAGEAASRFFEGLRNRTFLGTICRRCDVKVVPPLRFCPRCLKDMEFTPVEGKGEVVAAVRVSRDFPNNPWKSPYVLVGVKIDGTSSIFYHRYLHSKHIPEIGTRVRLVWEEETTGSLADIRGFEPEGKETVNSGEQDLPAPAKPKVINGRIRVQYEWALGSMGDLFRKNIRQGKLVGVKCPGCHRVLFPPFPYCGVCFTRCEEVVELPDEGVVDSWVPYYLKIPDSPLQPPVIFARIVLSGSHTPFNHLIRGSPESIRTGMRVRAVWSEKREGSLKDILYFEPVEE